MRSLGIARHSIFIIPFFLTFLPASFALRPVKPRQAVLPDGILKGHLFILEILRRICLQTLCLFFLSVHFEDLMDLVLV